MDVDDFVAVARAFFERVGRLDTATGKRVWAPVVGEYQHSEVVQSLEWAAYRDARLPSPRDFHAILASQHGARDPEARGDREERCTTCHARVGYYWSDEGWRRYYGSGGIMFTEHHGEWCAARCWTCGGPERFRPGAALALPIPTPLKRHRFRPAHETPLSGAFSWGVDPAPPGDPEGPSAAILVDLEGLLERSAAGERWILAAARATRRIAQEATE